MTLGLVTVGSAGERGPRALRRRRVAAGGGHAEGRAMHGQPYADLDVGLLLAHRGQHLQGLITQNIAQRRPFQPRLL
jgi:hypothetical protein